MTARKPAIGAFMLPLCGIGVVLGLLNWMMQGPVPGDILLTRGLQAVVGHQPDWAAIMTKGGTKPWVWAVTALVGMALYALRGARMALVAPLSFALAVAADGILRYFVYSPRPLAALVAVAKPSSTSGLPSTYGLVTGSTIGLLAMVTLADQRAAVRTIGWIAVAWLLAGWAARVTMGGHWTSQLLASYALSMMMGRGAQVLLRQR